jgi:hypothetical protein
MVLLNCTPTPAPNHWSGFSLAAPRRYLPYGNILGRFAENVLPPAGPSEASATFISEGQTLHAPDCYTSPNDKYLLCMRRDARLMLLHRTNTGNYTM